ncbi:metallo-beta-lactamase family protein [Phytophthora cinnamomi]|uniref:metallo-beta-lactamase family protein n=1 Tax=Phytophthora cinnamomi TaxID=4785 RepID=UPI00355A7B18|nr:metallo-beta-lactamase family protein [Phytophthora cinnamomi]
MPFPVIHAATYTSFGFEFGFEVVGGRFVYISDVNEFPEETRACLNDTSKPRIDVLVIDALYIVHHHNTHMNLLDVIEKIKTIRPKLTLLTGMSHEFDFYSHSAVVAKMGEEYVLRVAMAYNGMRLTFP